MGRKMSLFYLLELTNINPLTPNDHYSGRTAPLTSKCCILYIYSTNIGIEYFKHGIYSPCFSLQNAVCFIILTYLVPVLLTFYIQSVLKLKKINSGAKMLIMLFNSAVNCQDQTPAVIRDSVQDKPKGTDKGEPKYWGSKTCHSATLSTTNLTWTVLGSNPNLRLERPATDRLRQTLLTQW